MQSPQQNTHIQYHIESVKEEGRRKEILKIQYHTEFSIILKGLYTMIYSGNKSPRMQGLFNIQKSINIMHHIDKIKGKTPFGRKSFDKIYDKNNNSEYMENS